MNEDYPALQRREDGKFRFVTCPRCKQELQRVGPNGAYCPKCGLATNEHAKGPS